MQNLRTAAEGSTAICDRMPPKSAAATSDEEDRFQTSTLLLPTAVSAIKCAPSLENLRPTSELSCARDCSTATHVRLALLSS